MEQRQHVICFPNSLTTFHVQHACAGATLSMLSVASRFLAAGADYVDIAGSGGTNWITVETLRGNNPYESIAQEFTNWGYPTGYLLGAYAAGMALP